MITIYNKIQGLPAEDPANYLRFDRYNAIGKDCLFFYGGIPHTDCRLPSKLPKYFFSTEEQTWDLDSTDNYVDNFQQIFTICPPKFTNRRKRKFVFFPYPEDFIEDVTEKLYDVIYTGFASAGHTQEIINTIKDFNYRFVSFGNNSYITDLNVDYKTKLKLVRSSKIDVVHNLTGIGTPQLKTRPFEAAFNKSLILCKHDQFNILENWFIPEKEFLYYFDSNDLRVKIKHVLAHYDSYKHIINAAYNRAMSNYTTKHFIETYLAND